MNSQNTKAIGGSNCHAGGASTFQPNQQTVHTRTVRKNPHRANTDCDTECQPIQRCDCVEDLFVLIDKGFRHLMTASTEWRLQQRRRRCAAQRQKLPGSTTSDYLGSQGPNNSSNCLPGSGDQHERAKRGMLSLVSQSVSKNPRPRQSPHTCFPQATEIPPRLVRA